MVQYQEGESTVPGTLCGISLGAQHTEGAPERSQRAIRNVGLRCFPLHKFAKECNRGQQGSCKAGSG
eukprot:2496540-Prorocentrum_lima.AAC.1